MKKANRKLIPAVVMLLVSAIMLSTASFAWFSMNTTVTATGMQVQAKSDSAYLLIGTSANVKTIQAGNLNKVDFQMPVTEVYPSAHDAVTNTTDANDFAKWYTQVALDATKSDADESKGKTSLLEGNFGAHVIHKTVYVTLAEGSKPVSDLKATVTLTSLKSKTITPVKVLITTAGKFEEFSTSKSTGATVLLDEVTADAASQIDIFIYYDGNDSAVYTNNVANLDGASVEINFSVTGPATA